MRNSDVRVETEIEASIDKVWQLIINFSRWNEWHKSEVQVISKKGTPVLLKTVISGLPLRITLTDVKIVERSLLEWTGTLPFTGFMLKGVRRFELFELSPKRCKLVQVESFSGLICFFSKQRLVSSYSKRYALHNASIKRIVE